MVAGDTLSAFLGASIIDLFRILFVIVSVLYFIFSLIVVRQVNLMSQTVITEGGPILRALSIIFAGLALFVVVFFITFF